MKYHVRVKDGYSIPAKSAYLADEDFDSREQAQGQIDRLGLSDVLEVREGGIEDADIEIVK